MHVTVKQMNKPKEEASMAAGRDITRTTSLIRKEQIRRNIAATIEAEKRRTAAEAMAKMSPAQIRQQNARARRVGRMQREGHLVFGFEERMEGAGSLDDKMDRGENFEDKNFVELEGDDDGEEIALEEDDEEVELDDDDDDGEISVMFASVAAKRLAESFELCDSDFDGTEPSNPSGYTAQDVRLVRAGVDDDE